MLINPSGTIDSQLQKPGAHSWHGHGPLLAEEDGE